MDMPATHSNAPGRRQAGRIVASAAGLSLAAALLACDGSARSRSQNPAAASAWSNTQYGGSIGGDPAHGERIAREVCAGCHGADGNSVDPKIPKLAGQKLSYLYWELRAFKQDIRKSEVMSANLAKLSYADLADVANFYSHQPRKPDAVTNVNMAASGERLFFGGMPSCAMCHDAAGRRGMPMMGMMGRGTMGPGMMGSGTAAAPDLSCQHAAYIIDQLNHFASGERQGTVMNRVAGTLSGTDKMALAEFLSGTP
ncbi:c-type cytochrome [Sphingomonas histidinilytica]|jgi:cytochrome c553|uniref:c-type cytochrome n=1 Tax=Rhizorhabdus histidinilytica TaxID=439228 RepID=UPI001ADBF120|nr:c-type cytochrome [Rhizorhabdus histidinilytica]MBO9378133.1 c-type cytochrome [Rhizorhabdus histidinilytica]